MWHLVSIHNTFSFHICHFRINLITFSWQLVTHYNPNISLLIFLWKHINVFQNDIIYLNDRLEMRLISLLYVVIFQHQISTFNFVAHFYLFVVFHDIMWHFVTYSSETMLSSIDNLELNLFCIECQYILRHCWLVKLNFNILTDSYQH